MSTASPHLPAHHHAEPGTLARRLGHLGLAPFVAGALFVWLLGPRLDDEPFYFVVRGLTGTVREITAHHRLDKLHHLSAIHY